MDQMIEKSVFRHIRKLEKRLRQGGESMKMSKKRTLNKADLESMAKGFIIAVLGAAVTAGIDYIGKTIANTDFGQYNTIIYPFASLGVNAIRKYIGGK